MKDETPDSKAETFEATHVEEGPVATEPATDAEAPTAGPTGVVTNESGNDADGETREEDADGAAPEESAAPEERCVGLEEELAEARAELDQARNLRLRTAAEFENFRKRTIRERAVVERRAGERILGRLLEVADALDGAEAAADTASGDDALEQVRAGVNLITAKLEGLFRAEGMEAVEAEPGCEFDPNCHEALASLPSADVAEGAVLYVIQRGYMLGDQVLRPTRVAVSAGAPEEAPEEEVGAEPPGNDELAMTEENGAE